MSAFSAAPNNVDLRINADQWMNIDLRNNINLRGGMCWGGVVYCRGLYELDLVMFTAEYPRGPKGLAILGLALLLALLLVKFLLPLSQTAMLELLLTAGFLLLGLRQAWLRQHDWGVRMVAIGLLLPFFLLLIALAQTPTTALDYFAYEKLPRLVLFFTFGYWLGANRFNITVYWLAFALGLLLVLANLGWQDQWQAILSGQRMDFDIANAGHTSMLFGLAIVAVIAAMAMLWRSGGQFGWLAALACLPLLVVVVIAFASTQTRTAYIALLCLVALAVAQGLWVALRGRWLAGLLVLVALFAALAVGYHYVGEAFINNMMREQATFAAVWQQDWQNVPHSSLGRRVRLWLAALEAISLSPIAGLGESARLAVLATSDWLLARHKVGFGHFHNAYLEFTVAFGLLGLAWLVWLHVWVLKRAFQLRGHSTMHNIVFHFTLYSMVFAAVVNALESYWFFWSGAYAMAFYLAPAYSLHLASIYQRQVFQQKVTQREA